MRIYIIFFPGNKEICPNARVGAEGSVPGNLEEVINGLEFWGPYSDLIMDEVLRSIGKNKIRTLWWGGYVGSHGGRGEYPIPLWRGIITGNVNGNAWFTTTRACPESIIGSDMDFAHYAKKIIPDMLNMQMGWLNYLI